MAVSPFFATCQPWVRGIPTSGKSETAPTSSGRRTTALLSAVRTARWTAGRTPHAQDGGAKQFLSACGGRMGKRKPNRRPGKKGGVRRVDGMQIHQERSRLQG